MRALRYFPILLLVLAILAPASALAMGGVPYSLPWDGKATGNVKEFSLSIGKVQWEIEPGKVVDAYAYNGQVPGPLLRVTEGDTVRITVNNTLDAPTTVHWHGLDLPLSQDGVPGYSQDPIPPGGSYTYEFIATPAGTRWYHSHVDELHQLGGGLTGALIVDPREPSGPPADREYTLMTNEWGKLNPADASSWASDHAAMLVNNYICSLADNFTINGKTYAGSAPLVVNQGERVRLRLINAGMTQTQRFALAGHRLTIVSSDGNPLAQPVDTDVVQLGAGERADVEFTANNPGRWQLRGIFADQAARGLAVDVVYSGHEGDAAQRPNLSGLQTASYADFSGPAHPIAADKSFELHLNELQDGTGWTINGKLSPDTEPLEAQAGQRIRIALINDGFEDHPFHLHGHSFQVVSANGQPIDGPIKDTLLIRQGERYEIEFEANNPGTWLLHCHNAVHMAGGMMTEIVYR